MPITLYQVDAFTDVLFGGNPAAVCPLTSWLPDELMQKIALENNLSETVFFVKEGAYYNIRWFTPTTEVDLCGHATVATAHVMVKHLGIEEPIITFQSKSGELSVRREGDLYLLNFPADKLIKTETPPEAIQALGLSPQETYKGKSDYLLVFEHEDQIRNFQPDWNTLALVETRGFCVTAPGKDVDFVSRFFAPQSGINEDPVTGSAHTSLVPYWSKRLGKKTLLAKQISARGGILYCTDFGERTEIGGKAITYLIGTLSL